MATDPVASQQLINWPVISLSYQACDDFSDSIPIVSIHLLPWQHGMFEGRKKHLRFSDLYNPGGTEAFKSLNLWKVHQVIKKHQQHFTILDLELALKVPTCISCVNALSDNILPPTDSRFLATSLFHVFPSTLTALHLYCCPTLTPRGTCPLLFLPQLFFLPSVSHFSKSAQSLTSWKFSTY